MALATSTLVPVSSDERQSRIAGMTPRCFFCARLDPGLLLLMLNVGEAQSASPKKSKVALPAVDGLLDVVAGISASRTRAPTR